MATAVAFEREAISHFTAWIKLPHTVFSVEVVGSTVVVARLNHYVHVRVLCHSMAQVWPCVVIASVPRVHWAKHVVLQVGFQTKLFTQVMVNSWGKRM